MDQDIQSIYEEAGLEIELNHKVGTNHQYLIEEAIMNIAALNVINSKSTEEILGNSP